MGAGKPIRISYTLSINVFLISLKKYISLKKSMKYLNPTHLLAHIPILGVKFLKAITRPAIGI
jgi:hypothetical protein